MFIRHCPATTLEYNPEIRDIFDAISIEVANKFNANRSNDDQETEDIASSWHFAWAEKVTPHRAVQQAKDIETFKYYLPILLGSFKAILDLEIACLELSDQYQKSLIDETTYTNKIYALIDNLPGIAKNHRNINKKNIIEHYKKQSKPHDASKIPKVLKMLLDLVQEKHEEIIQIQDGKIIHNQAFQDYLLKFDEKKEQYTDIAKISLNLLRVLEIKFSAQQIYESCIADLEAVHLNGQSGFFSQSLYTTNVDANIALHCKYKDIALLQNQIDNLEKQLEQHKNLASDPLYNYINRFCEIMYEKNAIEYCQSVISQYKTAHMRIDATQYTQDPEDKDYVQDNEKFQELYDKALQALEDRDIKEESDSQSESHTKFPEHLQELAKHLHIKERFTPDATITPSLEESLKLTKFQYLLEKALDTETSKGNRSSIKSAQSHELNQLLIEKINQFLSLFDDLSNPQPETQDSQEHIQNTQSTLSKNQVPDIRAYIHQEIKLLEKQKLLNTLRPEINLLLNHRQQAAKNQSEQLPDVYTKIQQINNSAYRQNLDKSMLELTSIKNTAQSKIMKPLADSQYTPSALSKIACKASMQIDSIKYKRDRSFTDGITLLVLEGAINIIGIIGNFMTFALKIVYYSAGRYLGSHDPKLLNNLQLNNAIIDSCRDDPEIVSRSEFLQDIANNRLTSKLNRYSENNQNHQNTTQTQEQGVDQQTPSKDSPISNKIQDSQSTNHTNSSQKSQDNERNI